MDVMGKSYIFQSPYHSRVQVGIEDSSNQQNQNTQKQSDRLMQNSNETVKQAQSLQASQEKEVEPTVKTANALLDTYA